MPTTTTIFFICIHSTSQLIIFWVFDPRKTFYFFFYVLSLQSGAPFLGLAKSTGIYYFIIIVSTVTVTKIENFNFHKFFYCTETVVGSIVMSCLKPETWNLGVFLCGRFVVLKLSLCERCVEAELFCFLMETRFWAADDYCVEV